MPDHQEPRHLNLTDFGLHPDDATPAIEGALSVLRRHRGPAILRLPQGELKVKPLRAPGKFLRISNHDSGWRRVAFLLDNLSDLTIDGTGTQLRCEGEIVPFEAENARNVRLLGLSIDWVRPFHLEAQVTAVSRQEGCFEVQPFGQACWELRGDRLAWMERPWPEQGSVAWHSRFKESQQDLRWENELGWNVWFDSAKRAIATGSGHSIFHPYAPSKGRFYQASPTGNGRVRLQHTGGKQLPQEGWIMVDKGPLRSNRRFPAFHFQRCESISLEGITIHHAGGMGIIAEFCRDISLHEVRVSPSPGRVVSTTADATHFVSCAGQIRLRKCRFENMLDDGINVHGVYARVDATGSENRLCATLYHPQQAWFPFASAGDKLAVVRRNDLTVLGTATVMEVEQRNEALLLIRVKENIRQFIREEPCVLENLSWQANLDMRNCVVQNNRARAVLFSSRGSGAIVNNEFLSNSLSGILLEGDATHWHESGPVRDLSIVGNRIEGWGQEFGQGYGIGLCPAIPAEVRPEPYHSGVLIEGNTLFSPHGQAFYQHPACQVRGDEATR